MKSRTVGWFFLIIGGISIIISAVIGSDWPMYACVIISSAGVAMLVCARRTEPPRISW